jgi:multiple sugar transport system substrate-binding protein
LTLDRTVPGHLPRRKFLTSLVLAGAATALAACAPAAPSAPTAAPAAPKPAEAPKAAAPAAAPTTAPAAAPTTAPAAQPTAAAKPAATTGRKSLVMWSRQQFLPESNAMVVESAKLAAQENDFDVKVELWGNEDQDKREIVSMEAKQLPDLSMTVIGALWAQGGFAKEVSTLYSEIGKTGGGWHSSPEQFSQMAGKRIGIPVDLEPWIMHFRKDYFDAVGVKLPFKTYEDMIEGFKAVTNPTKNIYGFGGPMGVQDYSGNLLACTFAQGGRWFDKDSNPTIFTEKNLAGLTAYTDMVTKHKVMPPGVITWDSSGNNKSWLSGQSACVCNTGSIVLSMRKDDPKMLANTVLGAWPPAKGVDKPVTSASGFLLVTSTLSQNPDQAAAIIKKMMGPDRYPKHLEAAGSYWFSVMNNYDNIDFFTKDPANKQIAVDCNPYGIAPFADGGQTPVQDDMTIAVLADVTSMILVQGKSPEEALRVLEKQAKASVDKFKK